MLMIEFNKNIYNINHFSIFRKKKIENKGAKIKQNAVVSSAKALNSYNKAFINLNFKGNIQAKTSFSVEEEYLIIEQLKKRAKNANDISTTNCGYLNFSENKKIRFEQFSLFKDLLANGKIDDEDIISLSQTINNINQTSQKSCLAQLSLARELAKNKNYSLEDIKTILWLFYISEKEVKPNDIALMEKIIAEDKYSENEMSSIFDAIHNKQIFKKGFVSLDLCSAKIKELKKNVLQHPELYLNGEYDTKQEETEEIDRFFEENYAGLLIIAGAFDKETMNEFLRMRFESAENYLEDIDEFFKKDDVELFEKLCACTDMDDKPLAPNQKIDFINLILAYKESSLEFNKMHSMAQKGKVDITTLNNDLLYDLLRYFIPDEEKISQIPIEKLTSWDKKYMDLLSREIKAPDAYDLDEEITFLDVIEGANFYDFHEYIHSNNTHGVINFLTKNDFETLKLNYSAWVNPDKKDYIHFVSIDKNQQQFSQIVQQLSEDIETLLKTPAQSYITKHFPKYIKGEKFIIPPEIASSKAKLDEFIELLLKELDVVFKRAEINKDNPDKKDIALKTLTIQSHLKQRRKDIKQISSSKANRTIDLTIKMWDRIPQKDLFQGNYSTCCIGMNEGNGSAMPYYLLNTAFNMIEFVDNSTGETIGNALCYFVTNKKKPIFIIDNIEIRNSKKPSEKVGFELRNAIASYAATIASKVTGKDDTPIYMGTSYNDVPCDDLEKTQKEIKLLGSLSCNSIYLDAFDGWIDEEDDNYQTEAELYRLK